MTMLQAQQAAQSTAGTESTSSTAVPAQSAEMKKLLLSLKKDQEKLSPENQELVKSLQVKEEKDEEKELHQAVKKHGTARKDLRNAYEARENLHQKWRNFLSLSVSQWQAFTKEFQEQDQAALQQIQEAKSALAQARIHLDASKEAVHPQKPLRSTEEVDLMSEEEVVREDASTHQLQEGLNDLNNSLATLQRKAEQVFAEEQEAKKARVEGAKDVSGLPGGRALEPFASPGVSRP